MYRPLLERLRSTGRSIAFLSVGAGRYDDAEQQLVEGMLEEFRSTVRFVSTRDSVTFARYQHLDLPVYDGICGSMWVDEAVAVPELDRRPYVVVNVEGRYEPVLKYTEGDIDVVALGDPGIDAGVRARLRRRRARHDRMSVPTMVGPYEIIRTQSRPFTKDASALFDRPSTHYAVIPDGYFSLYKSAELVVTNRVHTCAATLVLAGRARYLATNARATDGRWFLLDRVGAGEVRHGTTSLDHARLVDEKMKLREFVASRLA
jgi:hypothetical protein